MRRACDRRVSRTRYDGRSETSASSGLRSAIGAVTGATTCSSRRCWVGTTRGGAPSWVRGEYVERGRCALHRSSARRITRARPACYFRFAAVFQPAALDLGEAVRGARVRFR